MVVSVAAHRLDRVRVKGRYMRVQIRKADLSRVKQSLLHALGMESWLEVEDSSEKIADAKPLKIQEMKIFLDTKQARQ
jgi:hypothetical protein